MTEDKPDFPISCMAELCTKEQKAKVEELVSHGWIASHIWEYPMSWLNVWMLIPHHKTEMSKRPYTHGYVKPSGEFVRVRLTNRMRLKAREE